MNAEHNPSRRSFLKTCVTGTAALAIAHTSGCSTPAFLGDQRRLYPADPRKARMAWFKQAGFGLFIHYGLYSQLGRGEWVMYHEQIPVAEYVKLKNTFTAAGYNADRIAAMAADAGMKYITITSKHHDGFCLFRTSATDYNSVSSPAKRDLIGELAAACRKHNLGLFLYYSYAADWKHPYFMPRSQATPIARPAYKHNEPTYLFRHDADFRHYIDDVHHELRELLTQYGPLAGIWFDPIAGYYHRPDLYPIEETYALVRSLQPGCLISFKQGANGDEDFIAPERKAAAHTMRTPVAQRAWELNKNKFAEICDTLQANSWGYNAKDDGLHKKPDEVLRALTNAQSSNANLLMNTGPLGDGSIHPEDIDTLREVGKRLRGEA